MPSIARISSNTPFSGVLHPTPGLETLGVVLAAEARAALRTSVLEFVHPDALYLAQRPASLLLEEEAAAISAPATLALLGVGIASIGYHRRKQIKKA
jgi:hypothetical protein